MIDSLVVVGGESAAGRVDLPVVEQNRGEGEEAAGDAADEAGEGAAAVAFEGELVFEGVERRFDPLADAAEWSEAWAFVLAVGADDRGAEGADVVFVVGAGEAFVADHGLSGLQRAVQELGGDEAFGRVGGCQLEADRQPIGGAQQVQPEAPEPAAVGAAVAVPTVSGER